MASTLTAVTVKSALVTSLDAALSIQVTYGYPPDKVERECLWVGQVEGSFAIPTMKAGRKYRDETYSIAVDIDVSKPGGTAVEAEKAAVAYLAELEDILADDPSATGGVLAAVAGDFDLTSGYEDSGSFARLSISVQVSNRLT